MDEATRVLEGPVVEVKMAAEVLRPVGPCEIFIELVISMASLN